MSLPKSRRQCTFKLQRVLSAFPVERLPELLPEELLREVLGKHTCLFGGVFHSAIVTWAFLCQVMRDGKDATCQAAVARISNLWLKTRGLSPVLHFKNQQSTLDNQQSTATGAWHRPSPPIC